MFDQIYDQMIKKCNLYSNYFVYIVCILISYESNRCNLAPHPSCQLQLRRRQLCRAPARRSGVPLGAAHGGREQLRFGWDGGKRLVGKGGRGHAQKPHGLEKSMFLEKKIWKVRKISNIRPGFLGQNFGWICFHENHEVEMENWRKKWGSWIPKWQNIWINISYIIGALNLEENSFRSTGLEPTAPQVLVPFQRWLNVILHWRFMGWPLKMIHGVGFPSEITVDRSPA